MNYKKLIKLIEEGEGLNVEFKQRFSTYEKISKELIAFANTRGGYLIVGVDDDHSIYGVDSEKSVTELIVESAQKYCEPPLDVKIDYFEIEGKEVVVVEVSESDLKPHRLQDYQNILDPNTAEVYVRVNDKSVLAGKEMIKILQAKTEEKSLVNYVVGKDEKIVFEFLDANETITVKELSKHANISGRRASRTLIKLVRADLIMIHTKSIGEDYFTYIGSKNN